MDILFTALVAVVILVPITFALVLLFDKAEDWLDTQSRTIRLIAIGLLLGFALCFLAAPTIFQEIF